MSTKHLENQISRLTGLIGPVKEMNLCIGKILSVCILTCNHVDVTKSTLQSILDQTIADAPQEARICCSRFE